EETEVLHAAAGHVEDDERGLVLLEALRDSAVVSEGADRGARRAELLREALVPAGAVADMQERPERVHGGRSYRRAGAPWWGYGGGVVWGGGVGFGFVSGGAVVWLVCGAVEAGVGVRAECPGLPCWPRGPQPRARATPTTPRMAIALSAFT